MTKITKDMIMNIRDAFQVPHIFCRTIGTPHQSGCWMTWGNFLVHGVWGEHPESVDPAIESLCMVINGILPDAERTRVIDEYGPYRPFGTAGDAEATKRRLTHLIDAAKNIWAPVAVAVADNDASAAYARQAVSSAVATVVEDAYCMSAASAAYATKGICASVSADAADAACVEFINTKVLPILSNMINLGPRLAY